MLWLGYLVTVRQPLWDPTKVRPSVRLSARLSVRPSVRPPVRLSARAPVRPSVRIKPPAQKASRRPHGNAETSGTRPSVHPSVRPSVWVTNQLFWDRIGIKL